MGLMEMSVSGAVLILVILAVRAALWNRLPKRTFAALWLIALIRLLVPFSVPSAWSAYSLMQNVFPGNVQQSGAVQNQRQQPSQAQDPAGHPAEYTAEYITGYTGTDPFSEDVSENISEDVSGEMPPVPGTASEGFSIHTILQAADSSIRTILQAAGAASADATIRSILQAVWAVGCLAGMLFFGWVYCGCFREFQMSLPMEGGFLRNWHETHPLRRKLSIRRSDRIASPLSYGIRRPVILLPKSVKGSDRFRLRYILEHEFVHILRFDAAVKLFMAAALCVHWFNPLVYLMYIFFNRDLEFACDEEVVCRFGEEEKAAYAMALIEMEEEKSGLHPLGNHFSKNAIEERIGAIMRMKKMPRAVHALSIAVVLSVTLLFATSSKAGGAAENTAQREKPAQETEKQMAAEKEAKAAVDAAVQRQNGVTAAKREAENTAKEAAKEAAEKAAKEVQRQIADKLADAAAEADSAESCEDAAYAIFQSDEYPTYKKFGLIYNRRTGNLMYKDKTVGYFKDEVSPGVYTRLVRGSGQVSITVKRNSSGKVVGFSAVPFDEISLSGEIAEEGSAVIIQQAEGTESKVYVTIFSGGERTASTSEETEKQYQVLAEATEAEAISDSDDPNAAKNSIPKEYAKLGVTVSGKSGSLWMYQGKGIAMLYDKDHGTYANDSIPEKKAVYLEVKRDKKGRVTSLHEVTKSKMLVSSIFL